MKGEVVLGVCGGIAAYKSAALTSLLVQEGCGVSVVLSAGGAEFVGRATFAALTGRPPAERLFDEAAYPLGAHIELAQRGDLLVVAPATAHFLARAAHGLADDLLTTLYLAFDGPVLLAPAMNNAMWEHPAVQRNVEQLARDGARFVPPESGWLSCRKQGPGRMAEADTIAEQIRQALAERGSV